MRENGWGLFSAPGPVSRLTDSEFVFFSDHEVRWLQVSVDHVLFLVQVAKSQSQLEEEEEEKEMCMYTNREKEDRQLCVSITPYRYKNCVTHKEIWNTV